MHYKRETKTLRRMTLYRLLTKLSTRQGRDVHEIETGTYRKSFVL